jgi:Glycosyltransferase family 87
VSRRGRRILWAVILAGLAIRLVVAFSTVGLAFDIDSYRIVAHALQGAHPLSLYSEVNTPGLRWPYPTGYFPYLLLVQWVSGPGLPFHGVISIAPIAADAGLAWIVQAYLGDRGASERTRLIAAALVALGPSFALHSGYEGQLDSAAILPAALALLVWQRSPVGRRALLAGVLIGVGASLKTYPGFVVLALVPWASDRRELATLVGATIAVPLLALAPWLAAEPHATVRALRYTGLPGLGGLSLLAQPDLATSWLVTNRFHLSGLTEKLLDIRAYVNGAAVAAAGVLLWRRRPDPPTGALIVYLAIFAFGLTFGPRYLLWALPFVLMAGHMWAGALLQAVTFPAAALLAFRTYDSHWVGTLYAVLMLALLAGFFVWLALLVREVSSGPVPPGGELRRRRSAGAARR